MKSKQTRTKDWPPTCAAAHQINSGCLVCLQLFIPPMKSSKKDIDHPCVTSQINSSNRCFLTVTGFSTTWKCWVPRNSAKRAVLTSFRSAKELNFNLTGLLNANRNFNLPKLRKRLTCNYWKTKPTISKLKYPLLTSKFSSVPNFRLRLIQCWWPGLSSRP